MKKHDSTLPASQCPACQEAHMRATMIPESEVTVVDLTELEETHELEWEHRLTCGSCGQDRDENHSILCPGYGAWGYEADEN